MSLRQFDADEIAGAVTIGAKRVGPKQPVYVIAEAGVNHDGSLDKALTLIDAAAAAGADAVKFQAFRAADLTTLAAPTADYQKKSAGESQRDLLAALEFNAVQFEQLAAHCRTHRVEFLATPFGIHELDMLLRIGVSAVKLASTDLDNSPLAKAAAASGKTLIVSVGAATAPEIDAAVRRMRGWGAGDRLVLLHCVSCYPTPIAHANLRAIGALRRQFGLPVGFSDHVQSICTGGLAVAAGACVLEKHFTLDRAATGPDHAMSLEPGDLRDYIRLAHEAHDALGTGVVGMSEIEADVRRVARKSIVAARNLPAGTLLTPDMLAIRRPAGGISPDQMERVPGRRLTVPVTTDTQLQWEMLR